jgi:uncharacterized membrane protein YgcG
MEGFISSIIVAVLNPEPIYEGMSYIAGIAAFFPWLYVVVIAVRLLNESQKALSFKSAISSAISDTSRTLLIFLIYTAGGALVFVLMFTLSDIFSNFGSVQTINSEMLDLRSSLTISAEDTKAWYEKAFEAFADTVTIPITAIIWVLFQLLSLAYVFLSQLIEILFAIAVVGLYAWGFLVIPTMTLGDEMNLSKSWKKSALTLFIWVIIEPIFLGVIWLMGSAASEYISNTYSGYGYGTNALTIWYLFSILMMFTVLLVRIITPFIAMYLARNDTFVGAIAGAAAASSALIMKQIMETAAGEGSLVREKVGAFFNNMAPNAEGVRHRDTLARGGQRVGDFLNTPVSDLVSRVSGGLGGLGGGPSESPAAETSGGGGADGGPGGSSSGSDLGGETGSNARPTGDAQTQDGLPGMPDAGDTAPGNDPDKSEAPTMDASAGGFRSNVEGQDTPNDLSASYEEYSNQPVQDSPSVPNGDDKGEK